MSPTSPPKLCNRCRTVHRGDCRPAWTTSQRRGSTRASRRLRAQILTEQPICAWPGCQRLATEDDHIVNHAEAKRRGWTEAQWDHPDNHQGLCHDHHTEKTRTEG